MLYHLLFQLRDVFVGFGVFQYITFRTAFAALTALLISSHPRPWLISGCGASRSGSSYARRVRSRIRPRPDADDGRHPHHRLDHHPDDPLGDSSTPTSGSSSS